MNKAEWKKYYFNYQKNLASKYYIPLIEKLDIEIKNKNILDVGCGDGGFITAFSEKKAITTGIEIKDFNWDPKSKVDFVVGNIINDPIKLDDECFDIIIIRDVIEHIKKEEKEVFLKKIYDMIGENGVLFVTFPPFYSPFGLHQQVFCKSKLKYIPFLSLLPQSLLKIILYLFKEDEHTINELIDIKSCAMTIRKFVKMIKKLDYIVKYQKYYFIRPSHELRYGMKTKISYFGKIPLIRELFVTGTVFVLKKFK